MQHDCVNTEGSYVCLCPPGYQQYGDRWGDQHAEILELESFRYIDNR